MHVSRAFATLASSALLASWAYAEPVGFSNADGYYTWTPQMSGFSDPCDGFFPSPRTRSLDPTRAAPLQDSASTSRFCWQDVLPQTGCTTSNGRWIGAAGGGIAGTAISFPAGCCGGCSLSATGPRLFLPGLVIGPNLSFSTEVVVSSRSNQVGNFSFVGSAGGDFVGFRIIIAGQTHYGWARIVGSAFSPTVTHWGYETTPNTPIRIPTVLPTAPVFDPPASVVNLRTGGADAGSPDPITSALSAAAGTQFSSLLTAGQCNSAASGPRPVVQAGAGIPSDPLSKPVLLPGNSSGTSVLYALGFALPPGFSSQSESRLFLSATGTLGASPGGNPPLGPYSQDFFLNCTWPSQARRTTASTRDIELRQAGRFLQAGDNFVQLNSFSGGQFTATGRVEVYPPLRAEVSPAAATIAPGASLQLSGQIYNGYDTNVTWSVAAGAGTVSGTGLYTAPAAAGVYQVHLAARADAGVTASATITVRCPADFNGDGAVDPDDLSDYVTCFFTAVVVPGACPEADYNADGNIDPDDLADFITLFFTPC